MLDPVIIRTQPEVVRAGLRKKQADVALIDQFLAKDQERKALLQSTETQQAELNAASANMATASPEEREVARERLRGLSDQIKAGKEQLAQVEAEWQTLLTQIPNLPDADVPEGQSDKENVVVRTEGNRPEFAFTPKTHEELAYALDLLDTERAAKVAGAKFYYLKNELVILEQAVLRYALDTLQRHSFTLMTVPHMARAAAFYGAGHFVTPEDAVDGDAYRLERDDLYLVGTAEVGLVNYHAGETLPESQLTARYAGISPCYRREAGTYGKEARGLYRVHQFQKVEMVSLVKPADSPAEHAALLAIAEEMLKALSLHYQVVLNCGGDLGQPQAKKWDIEVWLPGMQKFGETHSCSNDTDYQARSLGIKYKTAAGETAYVHTLNNTALASPRILVALLENGQQVDGSIVIPEVLRPYTGFERIAAR